MTTKCCQKRQSYTIADERIGIFCKYLLRMYHVRYAKRFEISLEMLRVPTVVITFIKLYCKVYVS